jgi:uncharacterized protein GlcG (DUF336 family)
MNPDELQERLQRLDPARGASTDPVTGPRAAALMEQIMQTDPTTANEVPTVPEPPRRPRRTLFAALGAVAVVAAGAFAFVALRSDDATPTSVTYSLAASDPLTAMCMALPDITPATDSAAFRGTVVAVTADSVTLDVTKWYANGSADQVVVSTAGMPSPALDGVTFEQGGDYLVLAGSDGQVGSCGLSGTYSPELEAFYNTWFG